MDVKDKLLLKLVTILGTTLTAIVGYATMELSQISKNLSSLNIKMAIVVERVHKHDNDIHEIKGALSGYKQGPFNMRTPKPLFEDIEK